MEGPSSAIARSADSSAAEQRALEAAFVAHETWAFEAAYRTYRALLYGAACAVLGNAAEAEDCVHDVLARLWQRGHAYTPARGSLRAFLAVCVRNEALSRRRKYANRSRIEHGTLAASTPEHSPEEHTEERIDVTRVLDSLGAPQRQVIQLAYYEGLTHEEIARRLGEPLGTVKSRLSNTLRSLRRALSGEAP
jgi:RNA polymerase sigma-70 factor (ECF subfamily)